LKASSEVEKGSPVLLSGNRGKKVLYFTAEHKGQLARGIFLPRRRRGAAIAFGERGTRGLPFRKKRRGVTFFIRESHLEKKLKYSYE